jgi:hypothetical protein
MKEVRNFLNKYFYLYEGEGINIDYERRFKIVDDMECELQSIITANYVPKEGYISKEEVARVIDDFCKEVISRGFNEKEDYGIVVVYLEELKSRLGVK